MNALANSYFFWIALILALLGLYILPSVIAIIRGVEGLGWIIVINLLPTGVGWLAALIGALMLPRRQPRPRTHDSRAYTPPVYRVADDQWPEFRQQW
jgi:Superinfection immunity protein